MQAIVIGAGAAGLAAAACLKQKGIAVEIREASDRIAETWRGHYDRLVLHTSRGRSALPGLKMPDRFDSFPTRDQLVEYLEGYARHHDLTIRFGRRVKALQRDAAGWRVTDGAGTDHVPLVVLATGFTTRPHIPAWSGLAGFKGRLLHSSAYRNAKGFRGRRVLVVGFGNSAADIALDLADGGAEVALSVRGPVNILPKTVLGLPTTSLGVLRRMFGPAGADIAAAPLLRALIGRPEDYGLVSAQKGPMRQVVEDGRIPLIDPGLLPRIKAGEIAVRPGIAGIEGAEVRFADGRAEPFDAIVAATGYDCDLRRLLPGEVADVTLDAAGRPHVSGAPCGVPGLFFCAYRVSPGGQLWQAAREAEAIAGHAAAMLGPGDARPA